MNFAEIQRLLMEELRLYHYPVAVTFLHDDDEIERFRATHDCVTPVKPMTFCQWEIAARMKGQTVLATNDLLDCGGAKQTFGWKEGDEKEVKAQMKYARSREQAEHFVKSKPVLPLGSVKAIAVGPLGDAAATPDIVHFYCDNMQSYHLAADYAAALNQHPLRPNFCVSSAACGGSVFSYTEKTFNMCPACSGSYNAGKTERGELNVMIPGEHIAAVAERLLERKQQHGSGALTRPGDHFPGADICKNCPTIIFKKDDSKNDQL